MAKYLERVKIFFSENQKKNEELYGASLECIRKGKEVSKKILDLARNRKKSEQAEVLLFNDDFTPMAYVVYVLENCFGLNLEVATR